MYKPVAINNYHLSLNEDVDDSKIDNSIIDYTLLEDECTEKDIEKLCKNAVRLKVKSICIYPKFVLYASKLLKDEKVLVCTVISFPYGTDTVAEKLKETSKAISDGADEIDMVLNYEYLKKNSGDILKELDGDNSIIKNKSYNELVDEVSAITDMCHRHKNKDNKRITLKCIVESSKLNDDETAISTYVCMRAGADFIKTSTGKNGTAAELSKIKIMYDIIKENHSSMKIKASGGIRTMSQITSFAPYIDRLGMGYKSVDKLNDIKPLTEKKDNNLIHLYGNNYKGNSSVKNDWEQWLNKYNTNKEYQSYKNDDDISAKSYEEWLSDKGLDLDTYQDNVSAKEFNSIKDLLRKASNIKGFVLVNEDDDRERVYYMDLADCLSEMISASIDEDVNIYADKQGEFWQININKDIHYKIYNINDRGLEFYNFCIDGECDDCELLDVNDINNAQKIKYVEDAIDYIIKHDYIDTMPIVNFDL